MCCDAPGPAALPPRLAAALDEYLALNALRPNDWDNEMEGLARGQTYIRWLGPQLFMAFAGQVPNWPGAVRQCLTAPSWASISPSPALAGWAPRFLAE
jgi:hypothetical protein